MKYTADTPLGVLLQENPEKAEILSSLGMHCVSCFAAAGETIGEACMVHQIEVNEILDLLNADNKEEEEK